MVLRNIEGATSYSFQSYTSYLDSSTKTNISNFKQEDGVLSGVSNTSSVTLQFSYLPNSYNLPNDMKVQLTPEKSHENHVDYHIDGNFEALRTEYDSNHQGWNSTTAPYDVTMFDEQLYTQESFPHVHFGFT